MPNIQIQNKFINGVHKVFNKMFTDAVYYVPLLTETKDDLYDEYVSREYGEPIALVGKAELNVSQGDVEPMEQKYTAVFNITLKSLREKGINVEDRENYKELRKGYVTYHGIYYRIDAIEPMTFVADVFIVYSFKCTEAIGGVFLCA